MCSVLLEVVRAGACWEGGCEDVRPDKFSLGVFNSSVMLALPVGHHLVTFTAYDVHGFNKSCSFNVTIEDREPPTPFDA